MYIQVRTIDTKTKITIDVSKTMSVADLKKLLESHFSIAACKQRLFFRGKQLEDEYSLFDYNINLNDMIQIMEKANVEELNPSKSTKSDSTSEDVKQVSADCCSKATSNFSLQSSEHFKVGEFIDFFDATYGAWFEGKIYKIHKKDNLENCETNCNAIKSEEGANTTLEHSESKTVQKTKETATNNEKENAEKAVEKSAVGLDEVKSKEALEKPTVGLEHDNAENKENSMEIEAASSGNESGVATSSKDNSSSGTPVIDDGYIYEVTCIDEKDPPDYTVNIQFGKLRPRSRDKILLSDLAVGDKVLANFNIEEQNNRGFWYDSVITKIKGRKPEVFADVWLGNVVMKSCKLPFPDELFRIEECKPLVDREPILNTEPQARLTEFPNSCDHCKNKRPNCKECGCHVCGLKTEEDKQVLCDECDYSYHIWCMNPPLTEIPDMDEWYCHECKNDENEIVGAGKKLKDSKKKAKMASKQNKTARDWGKGMACVGRTKVCTIVPDSHFGPIPGVEVGTLWKYRIQVSEAGVHRPHVAGIHGRQDTGAFSIVLSGGYEDDMDNGDEVLYTGSGGRDLSGNKRTSSQSCDQKLDRLNRALALNCNVKLNENGAEAKDWQAGKPVRVVRNYKSAKHSNYAPEDGNRYDGIYKVVKYFPKKGKSGYNMWQFLLRRDDPAPAPWTKQGQKRIEALGLVMQYPEGYLEAEALKNGNTENMDVSNSSDSPTTKGKRGKKRVLEESASPQTKAPTKKGRVATYELEPEISLAVEKDTDNEKLWAECKEDIALGKLKFLSKVEETFTCICCTEVVFKPITTPCHHNFCKECLNRSFSAQVMTCPTCRAPLEKQVLSNNNDCLQQALHLLFPGYSASR